MQKGVSAFQGLMLALMATVIIAGVSVTLNIFIILSIATRPPVTVYVYPQQVSEPVPELKEVPEHLPPMRIVVLPKWEKGKK